ncbi:MAG: hybrid sensor histidine kinase/response regulator, partial [Phormidesmis priestleyi]
MLKESLSLLESMRASSQQPERLLALHQYDILDTPSEQSFDDLTQLAASLCKTPVAVITFVDSDRQYFKSAFGAQMTTAPLEQGFCPFVVEQSQPLVVTDAPNDAKFHSHPSIDAMGLRFYAGVPLITAQGHAIGTICVVDFEPRQLSADQIDNLQALGRQVLYLLELRLSARQVAITNGALTAVSYGLAATVGDTFFGSLVQQFTEALNVDYAYISLIDQTEPMCMMKTIAVCHQGKIVDNFEYELLHTPCKEILERRSLCWHDRELAERFPTVPMIAELNIESYAAIPIFDHRHEPLGVLAVMDTKPLRNPLLTESLLTIFSLRISTELQRQRDQVQQADLLAQAQAARQQAEKANRIKDDFLAVVSHELRSPL